MGRCRLSAPSAQATPSAPVEALGVPFGVAPLTPVRQDETPCTYQLLIEIETPVSVTVGRFGSFVFPQGRYVYTGSARRHIEARIARHLAREKRLRWHIDYLLAAAGVRVLGVRRTTLPECVACRAVGGEAVVPGFGSSDCRAGCASHLVRLQDAGVNFDD